MKILNTISKVRQIPIFPPKIWSLACTCNRYLAWQLQIPIFLPKYEARRVPATGTLPGGCRYLFSYPKYEARQVSETWPVADTCFPTQNMKPGMYLRPSRLQVPIFQPKIWSPSNTWDLAGCRYLFSHLKYEARHVPETRSVASTYFPTHNMKPGIYLRPGQSQVSVFPQKIWSSAFSWDLTGCKYLFSYLKYKSQHIPDVWSVAGTLLLTQNIRRNIYLLPVPIFPLKI